MNTLHLTLIRQIVPGLDYVLIGRLNHTVILIRCDYLKYFLHLFLPLCATLKSSFVARNNCNADQCPSSKTDFWH